MLGPGAAWRGAWGAEGGGACVGWGVCEYVSVGVYMCVCLCMFSACVYVCMCCWVCGCMLCVCECAQCVCVGLCLHVCICVAPGYIFCGGLSLVGGHFYFGISVVGTSACSGELATKKQVVFCELQLQIVHVCARCMYCASVACVLRTCLLCLFFVCVGVCHIIFIFTSSFKNSTNVSS